MVEVAAGVIVRDGRVLACQRAPGSAHAGKWEFPGGKREREETLADCLRRELLEELGIEAEIGEPLWHGRHSYAEHSVELTFFLVPRFRGRIVNRAFTAVSWVPVGELARLDFLDADRPLVGLLARGALGGEGD